MEHAKQGLPDELITSLSRLVQQNQIGIAGTLLYVYFRRFWKMEEKLASAYMVKYFEKYHAEPLNRHRKRLAQG